jgi:alkylation response protein AidB-like acyl-CoA dehydrogenase
MIGAMGEQASPPPLGKAAVLSAGLNERGELDEPVLRADIARFEIDELAFRLTLERTGDLARQGKLSGAFSSVLKYYGAELNKRRYELLMAAGGSAALEWEGERSGNGALARDWLRSKANSIEGGTSEVQLNIISKRMPGA